MTWLPGTPSRRTLMKGAGAALGAGLTANALAPSAASASAPKTVTVLGGGIAGLTVAHELAERGFLVTVYEARQWGGKARSFDVPGSGKAGRRDLPAEHGFHVFEGGYLNLPDTLRRIPYGGNANGVFDNLVTTPQMDLARAGKAGLVLPADPLSPRAYTPDQVRELIIALCVDHLNFTPEAAATFAARMVVYLSSGDARRTRQWDTVPWSDFIHTDRWPGSDYSHIAGDIATAFLQGTPSTTTSSYFAGSWWERFLMTFLGRGSNGGADRVMNGPLQKTFVDPWVAHLAALGVNLQLGYKVTGLSMRGGAITGATIATPGGGTTVVTSDFYVMALPVEKARALWTSDILASAPKLGGMFQLGIVWENGVQFFLDTALDLARGHNILLDSPWNLSGILEAPMWTGDFAATYGDGRAKDVFSFVISNWDAPGILYGKTAKHCKPQEVADEVWAQARLHLNVAGQTPLQTSTPIRWYIDPAISGLGTASPVNEDQLVSPTVNSWKSRPDVGTTIANLVLAGDYTRGEWGVANMEAASASGRTAANVVLQRSGSRKARAKVISPYVPPEWAGLRATDDWRYAAGLPNQFDVEIP